MQATREVVGNTSQGGSPRELPGTLPPPQRSIPPETVSSARAGRDDGSWSVTHGCVEDADVVLVLAENEADCIHCIG